MFELEKQLISDAIRNAAMRFGVALDLWAKEDLHAGKTADVKRQVLDLCGGDTALARRAWDKYGDDLDAIEAWVNSPKEEA